LQSHFPDGAPIGAQIERTRSGRFLHEAQVCTVRIRRQAFGGKLPSVASVSADIGMLIAGDKEGRWKGRAIYFQGGELVVRKPNASGDIWIAAERQPSQPRELQYIAAQYVVAAVNIIDCIGASFIQGHDFCY